MVCCVVLAYDVGFWFCLAVLPEMGEKERWPTTQHYPFILSWIKRGRYSASRLLLKLWSFVVSDRALGWWDLTWR